MIAAVFLGINFTSTIVSLLPSKIRSDDTYVIWCLSEVIEGSECEISKHSHKVGRFLICQIAPNVTIDGYIHPIIRDTELSRSVPRPSVCLSPVTCYDSMDAGKWNGIWICWIPPSRLGRKPLRYLYKKISTGKSLLCVTSSLMTPLVASSPLLLMTQLGQCPLVQLLTWLLVHCALKLAMTLRTVVFSFASHFAKNNPTASKTCSEVNDRDIAFISWRNFPLTAWSCFSTFYKL